MNIYIHTRADSYVWACDPCDVIASCLKFLVISFLLGPFNILSLKINIHTRERERDYFWQENQWHRWSRWLYSQENQQCYRTPSYNNSITINIDSWKCSIFLVLQSSVCACVYMCVGEAYSDDIKVTSSMCNSQKYQ